MEDHTCYICPHGCTPLTAPSPDPFMFPAATSSSTPEIVPQPSPSHTQPPPSAVGNKRKRRSADYAISNQLSPPKLTELSPVLMPAGIRVPPTIARFCGELTGEEALSSLRTENVRLRGEIPRARDAQYERQRRHQAQAVSRDVAAISVQAQRSEKRAREESSESKMELQRVTSKLQASGIEWISH